jgi:hypothetical protein
MESTGTHCLNGFESFIPKITYRYRRWRVLTLLFTSSQDIIGMEECGRRFSPTTEIYGSDDLEQETTQGVASYTPITSAAAAAHSDRRSIRNDSKVRLLCRLATI